MVGENEVVEELAGDGSPVLGCFIVKYQKEARCTTVLS